MKVRSALRMPLNKNIIKVHMYWTNNPLVSLDSAGDPNPEGIKVTYYAESGDTGKGMPADGLIRFKLYVIYRPVDEEPYEMLAHTMGIYAGTSPGLAVG